MTSDRSEVLVTGLIRLATQRAGSKVEGFFGLNQAGCWSGILCPVLTFQVHWKSLDWVYS